MGVTNKGTLIMRRLVCIRSCLVAFICVALSTVSQAAVLPEEKTEALFHQFEGGGVTINGPSILVRKNIKETVSLWGNYYVDSVTSASVDVMTQGSPYTEERVQTSVGADYLYDRTTMSLSFTESTENDYEAQTIAFGVSQDMFGDLTTISMGFSRGNDTVMRNGDEEEEVQFEDTAQHSRYSLGLSQILTKNWIASFVGETVIDEGFLNNPYRSVRYTQPDGNIARQAELYPRTRNSDAFALRSMYYLPYRAALKFEYRVYSDSWGIEASNYELRYIHPFRDKWKFTAKYRGYSQTQANFYSDLFPYSNAQEFLARDKELSTFSDSLFGFGVSYEVKSQYLSALDKVTLNLYLDHMKFDYENFRNDSLSQSTDDTPAAYAPGEEPFYSFDANVLRIFISIAY